MVVANRLSEISPDETAQEFDKAIYLAIDTILSNGNIYWTGEDIRKWLASEGFHIVKGPKVGDGRR